MAPFARLARLAPFAAASLAVLLVFTACSEQRKETGTESGGPEDKTVVGRIGSDSVTVKDIDDWIKEQLFNQTTRGRNPLKLYEIRNRALEQMASEQALDAEAKKAGKDRDMLLKDEVEKRASVSDAEVQQYYDDHKDRFRNLSFDKVAPAVKRQLLGQKQVAAMQDYVGGLRKTLGYENKLEPPRFDIAAGSSPTVGPADAPVTLVEFSDYECPFCKSAEPIVAQVLARYPTQVRLVYKSYPLDAHPKAKPAAEAAFCANEQGKFWDYHKKLFEKAPQIGADQLSGYAEEAGLDKAKFDECIAAHRSQATVQADLDAGKKVSVSGTPAFFVNGVPLSGGRSLDEFAKAIDAELARLGLPVPPPPPPTPAAQMMPPGPMMPPGHPPVPPQPNATTPPPGAPPAPNAAAPHAAAPSSPAPAPAAASKPAPKAN